jgi:hypothetical protein
MIFIRRRYIMISLFLILTFSLSVRSLAFQPVPPSTTSPPPSSFSPSLLKSTLSNETLNIVDNYSKKVNRDLSTTSMQPRERKLGILFLNLGGPETLKVPDFFSLLFYSWLLLFLSFPFFFLLSSFFSLLSSL